MSTEIGAIDGLIELQDNFTSQIGIAQAALSNFSKENQESLKAVAGAAGILGGALIAVGAATLALGSRGADINDLAGTIEHFSGSAQAANEAMAGLRTGTLDIIDDFTLAENAARVLQAGVKLTGEEFNTLGSAAFVLANRGLGSTKEMLELVSDAMATGKTKSIALALGINDIDTATKDYADSIGVEVSELTDEGQAHARRLHVMELLKSAVADAGAQERDFGEQIEFAKTQLVNWSDRLGSAIAESPALAAGMQAVSEAITQAFGTTNQDSIQTVLEGIKGATLIAIDFGLGMVEAARVVNVAWSAIKVIILGTETVIMGIATAVSSTIASILTIASSLPGATQGMADMATAARGTSDELKAMTLDLADQTAEAAKGLIGASEFDKTLDKLGGTIMGVRDAVSGADAAMAKSAEATDVAATNVTKLAAAQKDLTAKMVDRQKIEDSLWKVEEKSLNESNALWTAYFVKRASMTGTSYDAQRAQISKTFNDEIAKLDASDRNYADHYAAIKATADQATTAMGSDWDSVKDKSIEALNETARVQRQTYNDMFNTTTHFSREVMDEQLDKTRKAEDAARNMGRTFKSAFDVASDAASQTAKEVAEVAAKAKHLSDVLVGLVTGVFDAAGNDMTGMAFSTREQMKEFQDSVVAAAVAVESTVDEITSMFPKFSGTMREFVELGQAAIRAAMAGRSSASSPELARWLALGGHAPGFAEGGLVTVGEKGSEVVRLPFGSQVFRHGSHPSERDEFGRTPPGFAVGGVVNNNLFPTGSGSDPIAAAEASAKTLAAEIAALTAEIALKTTGAAIGPQAQQINQIATQIATLTSAASVAPAAAQAEMNKQIAVLTVTMTALQKQAAADLFSQTIALKTALFDLQNRASFEAAILAKAAARENLEVSGELQKVTGALLQLLGMWQKSPPQFNYNPVFNGVTGESMAKTVKDQVLQSVMAGVKIRAS